MIGLLVALVLLFFPAEGDWAIRVVGCESRWEMTATSPTGAGGLWQFTAIAQEDARRLAPWLPAWNWRYDPWWSTVAAAVLVEHYGTDGHVWAESRSCWAIGAMYG